MKIEPELEALLSPYTFKLPDELIARYPASNRSDARMLVIHRGSGEIEERSILDLHEYLKEGDVIARNRTRVSRRRVRLRRSGGGAIEALFLEPLADGTWICLLKKSGRLRYGEELRSPDPAVRFVYEGKGDDSASFSRLRRADAGTNDDIELFFEIHGEIPIPPYLRRAAEPLDSIRYQTVYATAPGSVAAPTAGLHLDTEILEQLRRDKIGFADVELQIGYGTFAPLRPENFEKGRLHEESYEISAEAATTLNGASRIIAVGTTTLRALESNFRRHAEFRAGRFQTSIFLHPPERIGSVHGLLTNFHLPASSLFMLVCSFAGTELMQKAYALAIQNRYRFFSYGDASLIID